MRYNSLAFHLPDHRLVSWQKQNRILILKWWQLSQWESHWYYSLVMAWKRWSKSRWSWHRQNSIPLCTMNSPVSLTQIAASLHRHRKFGTQFGNLTAASNYVKAFTLSIGKPLYNLYPRLLTANCEWHICLYYRMHILQYLNIQICTQILRPSYPQTQKVEAPWERCTLGRLLIHEKEPRNIEIPPEVVTWIAVQTL